MSADSARPGIIPDFELIRLRDILRASKPQNELQVWAEGGSVRIAVGNRELTPEQAEALASVLRLAAHAAAADGSSVSSAPCIEMRVWVAELTPNEAESLSYVIRLAAHSARSAADKNGGVELIASYFWFVVHNLLAHSALLSCSDWADRFHAWSAERMQVADEGVDFEKFGDLYAAAGGVILALLIVLLVLGAADLVRLVAGWAR